MIPMTEPTEEQKKKAVESFIKEYGELVRKYKVDFVAYPVFLPNEKGSWELKIQNQPIYTGDQPKKSPFVAQ